MLLCTSVGGGFQDQGCWKGWVGVATPLAVFAVLNPGLLISLLSLKGDGGGGLLLLEEQPAAHNLANLQGERAGELTSNPWPID